MEMAYHEQNQREYELTKNVSLLQVDPLALIQLRTTGRCTVKLPESLFDMDGPGHYFRRIKTVAVTIPCVTGPYVGVNCTLTLLKSSIRKTPNLRDGLYAREDAEDDRFSDNFSSLQSIVTSSAQNDSGLFETSLRDERYLPFENSGVVSEWQLQLPANPGKGEPAQFDYDTISDVILHLRYTAREGGGLLRGGAIADVTELIKEAKAVGSVRLLSVRQEFPSEWAKFLNRESHTFGDGNNQVSYELALNLRPEHYPFWGQKWLGAAKRVDILARSSRSPVPGSLKVLDQSGNEISSLVKDATRGGLMAGTLTDPGNSVGKRRLYLESKELDDLWIAVTWGDE